MRARSSDKARPNCGAGVQLTSIASGRIAVSALAAEARVSPERRRASLPHTTLTREGKPVAIILHTEMGNGVNYMMGTHKWHGSAPNDEQLADALSQNLETLGDY